MSSRLRSLDCADAGRRIQDHLQFISGAGMARRRHENGLKNQQRIQSEQHVATRNGQVEPDDRHPERPDSRTGSSRRHADVRRRRRRRCSRRPPKKSLTRHQTASDDGSGVSPCSLLTSRPDILPRLGLSGHVNRSISRTSHRAASDIGCALPRSRIDRRAASMASASARPWPTAS